MANVRWTGNAQAVAQVDTFTPGGTIEADDLFILTITRWDGPTLAISAAAGGTGASDVVTALKAALDARSTLEEDMDAADTFVDAFTWSGTTTLILTAAVAGVPFSVAGTTTEANGSAADSQTFSRAATTASAGPNHWDSANNWDIGAVPGGASGQNVYIDFSETEILYGLNQSGIANALASLHIGKTFAGEGKIGVNGAAGYAGTYLDIDFVTADIGEYAGSGTPAGSGRIMLSAGASATQITIHDAGSPADENKPAVRLKANSASTTIEVKKGTVGIAYESGETTTVSAITVAGSEAKVYVGAGTTVDVVYKSAGDMVLSAAATITEVTNEAGTIRTTGSAAITTFNTNGGTATLEATGTITNLIMNGGLTDQTTSTAGREVTNPKVARRAMYKFDPAYITLPNGILPVETTGVITLNAA